MQETFNIKQDFKSTEYLRAMLTVSFKLKMIRIIIFFGIIIGLLRAVLDIALSPESKSLFSVVLDLVSIPIFLLLFFSIFITGFSTIIYRLKPKLIKGMCYRFTHWGMEKFSDEINLSVPWKDFVKYNKSQNFIFLFLNENHSHIVQKRMFASPAELDNFRNFITLKIQVN